MRYHWTNMDEQGQIIIRTVLYWYLVIYVWRNHHFDKAIYLIYKTYQRKYLVVLFTRCMWYYRGKGRVWYNTLKQMRGLAFVKGLWEVCLHIPVDTSVFAGPYYGFDVITLFREVSIGHLQRMRLANRGRLLLRTPGPVAFGTCICSYVETILSWTCYV